MKLPPIGEASVEVGYGIKVKVCEQWIRLGSRRFIESEGILIPNEYQQIEENGHEQGYSLVYVAQNAKLGGAIELRPTIRPEAKRIVSQLRKHHIEMLIISGDQEKPTQKLAQEVGIEHYFAQTLPENKASLVEDLQKQGKTVCFVGDGINDSIALKKANVSISLRGASSAATDTAQIILMNQDLNQLICAFDVAQHFERNMKLNLTTTIVPGLITIYGAFFLGFGIVHSVISNNTGLMIGVSNAIWPWLKEQKLGHRAPRPLIPLEKKEDKLLIDSEKFSQKEDFIRRLP